MALRQRYAAAAKQQQQQQQQQPIGAYQMSDLTRNTSEDVPSGFWSWIRFNGRHRASTTRETVHNGLMEVIGMFILGTAVPLVAFSAGPVTDVSAALVVGVTYALALYAACCLPRDMALRAHMNPAISVMYMSTREIGFLGLLFYLVMQGAGAFAAGGLISAVLDSQGGAGPALTRAVVPLPVTVGGTSFAVSRSTVMFIEFLVPCLIALIQMLTENLNTDNRRLTSNYYRAAKHTAIITGVVVTILYPYQMWSFNGMVYLAGIASGLLTSTHTRQAATLAQLQPPDLPNSVFTGDVNIWAYYIFIGFVSGIGAGLIGRILLYLGFRRGNNDNSGAVDSEWKYRHSALPYVNPGRAASLNEPLLQEMSKVAATDTQVKDLIGPSAM